MKCDTEAEGITSLGQPGTPQKNPSETVGKFHSNSSV